MTASGTLLIVSTPIGNADDITLRAIKALGAADTVVCEEEKEGQRLLRTLDLEKPLLLLNEHSNDDAIDDVVAELREGRQVALISDAGTPLLADPGHSLVRRCLQEGIGIEVVPGASSILTAIVRSGFDTASFLFAGFVRRGEEERIEDLRALSAEPRTVILLEAPYRLRQLLSSAAVVMPERPTYVGCNLTMPSESHHYGTAAALAEKFTEKTFKGEFVVCFQGTAAAAQQHTDIAMPQQKGRPRKDNKQGRRRDARNDSRQPLTNESRPINGRPARPTKPEMDDDGYPYVAPSSYDPRTGFGGGPSQYDQSPNRPHRQEGRSRQGDGRRGAQQGGGPAQGKRNGYEGGGRNGGPGSRQQGERSNRGDRPQRGRPPQDYGRDSRDNRDNRDGRSADRNGRPQGGGRPQQNKGRTQAGAGVSGGRQGGKAASTGRPQGSAGGSRRPQGGPGPGRSQSAGRPQGPGGRQQKNARPQQRGANRPYNPQFDPNYDPQYASGYPDDRSGRGNRAGGRSYGGGRAAGGPAKRSRAAGNGGFPPVKKRAVADERRTKVYTSEMFIKSDFTEQKKPTERKMRSRRKRPESED